MKLIAFEPYIIACATKAIMLTGGIEAGIAREFRLTNIFVVLKYTYRILLGRNGSGKEQ